MNRILLFQVFDWNKSGKEDFIGQFTASLADIQRKRDWDLINPHKQKKKSSYRNSGVLHFRGVDMIKEHSFLDYILGGTEINLAVAIDYTASNGYDINSYIRQFIMMRIFSICEISTFHSYTKIFRVSNTLPYLVTPRTPIRCTTKVRTNPTSTRRPFSRWEKFSRPMTRTTCSRSTDLAPNCPTVKSHIVSPSTATLTLYVLR